MRPFSSSRSTSLLANIHHRLANMALGHFDQQSGGFIAAGLLSPAPSVASNAISILPHPRETPLKSGGAKETALLNFVEGRLREISARFERRFQHGDSSIASSASGYGNATDIVNDLDRIVDIVWVSGTRKPKRSCWKSMMIEDGLTR